MEDTNKDISFDEAFEESLFMIRGMGRELKDIKEMYGDMEYFDELVEKIKNTYHYFKSGDFEVFYQNLYELDDYINVCLGVPNTKEFYQDLIKHIYETHPREEVEEFLKVKSIRKDRDDEYRFIIDTLLREKNNIRFDVDIL